MDTEDAFQGYLDAHPDDHLARLVFADWLEERGDPRAEGYRVIGQAMRDRKNTGITRRTRQDIQEGRWTVGMPTYSREGCGVWWQMGTGDTRRAAEDAAALAFARLPPERRAELLGAGRAAAT